MDNTQENTISTTQVYEPKENPNIFKLKIEDIPGSNDEVLTIYLYELKNFMRTHQLSKSEKMIYSALQSALEYYKYISDPTSPFFNSVIQYTETETFKLQKKYPNLDIKTSLRIKSPISAYNKILDKIQEYIRDGRDLNDLNSSLRDFIGIRRIVSPKNTLMVNPKKSTLRTLDFVKDQLAMQSGHNFNFIPIRKSKIDDIETPHSFTVDPQTQKIYIPKLYEIPKLLLTKFRYIGKNYIAFPKKSLYQSYQYCTYLPFSDKYAVEYQIRDENMHKLAESGIANHHNYKLGIEEVTPSSKIRKFSRANLPIEYVYDNKTKKMVPYTLSQSMKDHLGYSFEEKFNISEEEFYKSFTKEEQDDILALHSGFRYSEETKKYEVYPLITVPLPPIIKVTPEVLHEGIQKTEPIHSGFSR